MRRSRGVRVQVALGVLVACVLSMASVASSGAMFLEGTAAPDPVTVGQSVTFMPASEDDNCPTGEAEVLEWEIFAEEGLGTEDEQMVAWGQLNFEQDGSWQVQVLATFPPGDYILFGYCALIEDETRFTFGAYEIPFTVAAAQPNDDDEDVDDEDVDEGDGDPVAPPAAPVASPPTFTG